MHIGMYHTLLEDAGNLIRVVQGIPAMKAALTSDGSQLAAVCDVWAAMIAVG